MIKKINLEELTKEFIDAVNDMKNGKSGTYHWRLPIDDAENTWAIVLGYSDGFDGIEPDEFSDGVWRLCVKLAYQPHNSMLQCDYDVDWLLPYDDLTGDVGDSEVALYSGTNLEEAIAWLWKQYEEYEVAFK